MFVAQRTDEPETSVRREMDIGKYGNASLPPAIRARVSPLPVQEVTKPLVHATPNCPFDPSMSRSPAGVVGVASGTGNMPRDFARDCYGGGYGSRRASSVEGRVRRAPPGLPVLLSTYQDG
jgi:hypothetical protein